MADIIYLIRHTENPPADGSSPLGVDGDGATDRHSLTPQGWQRAGCWTVMFAPPAGITAGPAKPGYVYASARDPAGMDEESKSRRPVRTVTQLARLIGMPPPDQVFSRSGEAQLAAAVLGRPGIVLVCWQYENIPLIANAILPGTIPPTWKWPGTNFNGVFVFSRGLEGQGWSFGQLAPVLLDGDPATPVFQV